MPRFLQKLPFAHQSWFLYLQFLIRHFIKDNCPQKSASLTYTTLLSIVPIITVILVLFSVVPALSEAREHVQQLFYQNLLPTGTGIREYLDNFAQKSSNLGLIGTLGLFLTTMMTLLTIENAFNQIWQIDERTGGLSSILRYWTMMTLAPIVLGVAFGASSAIRGLSFLNQQILGYGIDWAVSAQILSFLVMVAGFIGMYWFIPKTQVPAKNAIIAGVVSAVLFEILKQIFGIVMKNFTSYEAVYGAFAALPFFLLWLYLSWNIVLLGVEISYTLMIFHDKHTPKHHPFIAMLGMLHVLYVAHQQGKTVPELALRQTLGQDQSTWRTYVHHLTQSGLIAHTIDNHYVLTCDLKTVNAWEFYQSLPHTPPSPTHSHDTLWLCRIGERLSFIEQTTKEQLNISLTELFDENTNPPEVHSISSDDTSDALTTNHGLKDKLLKQSKVMLERLKNHR